MKDERTPAGEQQRIRTRWVPPRKLRFYSLLGLEPGATLEELKRAHRDLVKVWHPDRFHDDPPLQRKAQEKLKEINEAYEQLLPEALPAAADPVPETQLRPRPFAPEVRREAGPEAPAPFDSSVPPEDLHPLGWQRYFIFRAAAALLILVVLTVIVVTVLLNRGMHRSFTAERTEEEEPATSGVPVEATSSDTPTFSLRSTQSEVLSVQGTPTSVEGNRWMYELSSVDFVDGKVESYANVSRNLHVRLEPQGDVAAERARGYFALESSPDAVLAVQGTPTSVQGRRWRFDSSYVDFAAGKVESYSNASRNLHVRVDPAGDVTAARARGYFTLGSTPDEVLAVEGTPTSIDGGQWTFGASSVGFADGRVDSYANVSQNLHVQILPRGDSAAARERGYFTLGASQDDVLAVQGTPSSVQDSRWWSYELSWVKFEDDKVASYSNVSGNLRLKVR